MTHDQIQAAAMTSRAINDLPDSAFAYIEPGGSKDAEGKTTPRSLRHFPIHDEAHTRNALARASQSPFGEKALPKIHAACKRFGIRWSGMDDKVYAAAELRDIEIARPGKWRLSSGEIDVTPRDLDDAARFANREGARPGYLKIGHTDTRFMASDGEPALGWLHNIRLEEDEQGHVLKGDLHDVPDWLAEAIPRHWPDRSMEGYAGYEHQGQRYGLVVDGLALLGVTPPGMSSLKSLRDLPAALGVAASGALEPSGTRIVASFGDPTTSASEAEEPKKGAGMNLAKYREVLDDLPDDASEEDIGTALVEAGLKVAPTEGTPVAAAAAPGTIVLASSTYEELQRNLKTMNDFMAKTKRDERDDVIARAVGAGKFTPAQRQHFARLWDVDPDGTRSLIDTLTPNSALAVMASGYAGDVDGQPDELDREIERLSDPARTRAGKVG